MVCGAAIALFIVNRQSETLDSFRHSEVADSRYLTGSGAVLVQKGRLWVGRFDSNLKGETCVALDSIGWRGEHVPSGSGPMHSAGDYEAFLLRKGLQKGYYALPVGEGKGFIFIFMPPASNDGRQFWPLFEFEAHCRDIMSYPWSAY